MHGEIISESIDGIFKYEKDYIKTQSMFKELLEEKMRGDGVVPVLDMGFRWTTWYDEESDEFNFKMTVYGSFVGVDEAQNIVGVESNGKIIMKG